MTIDIRPLNPALIGDYFDFFDNRAFSDHEEWSCCYCTYFHIDAVSERALDEAIGPDGDVDDLRRVLKGAAEKLINEGTLRGYLAYADGIPVGWCNANDKTAFSRFDHEAEVSAYIRGEDIGRVKAVTCFTVAPEYREKWIATALLARVLRDAKDEGYAAVEGYPRQHDQREPFDYYGPVRLYEKAGFVKAAEQGHAAVMRCLLSC
jgi:GNAT superfamily N-acetyltransferase